MQVFSNLSTTSQEAKGGSSTLAGRKYLHIWNRTGSPVFWSFDSDLSGSNVLTKANGAISEDEHDVFPFGPNLKVYICIQTGKTAADVVVTEIA